VLINGSKVAPKVAILKPISAAIAIGSGGPFGAEGPIIMTGGAFGSLIAQFLQLTAAERKTLLAAGAGAGMTAIFNSPVAAVLLAIELLLFEWKPRSVLPVAVACFVSDGVRSFIIGTGPLFPVPAHPDFVGPIGMAGCLLAGLLAGLLAIALTQAIYAVEDGYARLPIHWMWWPALGGLVVGAGGLFFPQALGVGYDVIGRILQGNVAINVLWGVLLVKAIIWAVSLGSGTSGGVVAPVLMIGAALGGLEASFMPNEGAGFWALISMAATLAAVYRSPLTGVVFALELTHDVNALLPLLITVFVAVGLSVLVMRRSILTERIARRGYHVSAEYSTDPLQILFVREVMRTSIVALPDTIQLSELAPSLRARGQRAQMLYPLVDPGGRLKGVLTRADVQRLTERRNGHNGTLGEVVKQDVVVAHPDEPLQTVLFRMADTSLTRFPVVERGTQRVVGMIALSDMLKAHQRHLDEERHRERVLTTRIVLPFRQRREVHTAPLPDPAPASGAPDETLLSSKGGERLP
jgi:H+/Cl- antiporter ClcA